MEHNINITDKLSKKRLDIIISQEMGFSRSYAQKIIKEGHVKVNDIVIIKPKFCVVENDNIIISVSVEEEYSKQNIVARKMDLDIFYEDDYLLVLNKQANLTIHPGAGNKDNSLVNGLVYYLGENLSSVRGSERPGIVHRLDRDTTGLMVVAKNNLVHHHLSEQIKERKLIRKYKALVWGVINPLSGTISNNITRSDNDRTRMSIVQRGGKIAITHYNTIKIFKKSHMSLVECQLSTGRTHQIRVQLSNLGHSIIGDQKYGHNLRKVKRLTDESLKKLLLLQKAQLLHSYYISFLHPVDNNILSFESTIPNEFNIIIDYLK